MEPKRDGNTDSVKSMIKDIIIVLCAVAVIGIALFAVSGTCPALVAVESGSMEPNIQTYSLVFVSEENRFGDLITMAQAELTDADKKFNGYGDVIVYMPDGISGVTPIIHRAIGYVSVDGAKELGFEGNAAHAGYITKGDNNPIIDQMGTHQVYGRLQPVKEEWIIGKAVFAIPMAGWIPLHIWQSILVVIGILIVYELIVWLIKKRK
ncbi:MAG: S26 family signal peptidase [Methanocorpusculum sp.]|nr:S26 family signal peptidase [Methanocorpusculum sp.]